MRNRKLPALAFVLALSAGAMLAGSGAYAQSGWNRDASREPDAKKTPPPPPIQIAGSWIGPIQDSKAGNGTINLTFTEKSTKTKGILKGTFTVSYSNGPEGNINDLGTLTGSVVGSGVAFTLIPRRGDALGHCRLIFSAPDATAEMISGPYHLSGCGNTGTISIQPGSPPPAPVFINVGDDFFYPPKVTISAGQTVRWTNNGIEDHTVTSNAGSKCRPSSSEAFDSSSLSTGTTFDHTFNSTGIFGYYCVVHGCPMHGTITVK